MPDWKRSSQLEANGRGLGASLGSGDKARAWGVHLVGGVALAVSHHHRGHGGALLRQDPGPKVSLAPAAAETPTSHAGQRP